MLDSALAAQYELPIKGLKQALKRHFKRFPDDFMFVDHNEFMNWRSQFVTSNSDLSTHADFARKIEELES